MSETRMPAVITPVLGEFLRQGSLWRVRKTGYAILALQLVVFFTWSVFLYTRYALTWDFATYYQPWFLVAHGNLDPVSTLSRMPFWQNDAEFMPWILAPLYWLFRNPVGLLWLQDLSVVGAEAVVFKWICDVATERHEGADAARLASLGLFLLVVNPWIWWTVSFDVHEEVLVLIFVALLARDMVRGRRRAWLWAALVMAGGAPSATYVIGLGLGVVLATRRIRSQAAMLVVVAIAYSLLIVAIHGDAGVTLAGHYGYLVASGGTVPVGLTIGGLVKGVILHPQDLLDALWTKLSDIFANLAASGLVGIAAPLVLPITLVVLMANTLSAGYRFSEPLFQSAPIYVLLPLGTVMVMAWIASRHRRTALAIGCALSIQALGWMVVWGPVTPGQWVRMPADAASTLAGIESRIPSSAEVVASQGVVGRFSGRTNVYGLSGPTTLPVARQTWFVLTPDEGIETLGAADTETLIGELAGPLDATLVAHANGVWAFVWNPPSSIRDVNVSGELSPLPAWTSAGAAGRAVLTGPESSWHVTSTGARGYVADQLEWQAPPGSYTASVTLSTTGPVNVEVWNDTGNVLLARKTLMPTDGLVPITLPVNATTDYRSSAYAGWGPFHADFALPPAGERLEVRVWSPGNTLVNVYSADLTPVGRAGES